MCAYLSKVEDECSHAMNYAFKKADAANYSKYEQMRLIACAYSSKTDCSVQEAVYQVMSQLWFRKTFPAVLFGNSNLPQNRYRINLKEAKLEELPGNSTDVFKKNC